MIDVFAGCCVYVILHTRFSLFLFILSELDTERKRGFFTKRSTPFPPYPSSRERERKRETRVSVELSCVELQHVIIIWMQIDGGIRRRIAGKDHSLG